MNPSRFTTRFLKRCATPVTAGIILALTGCGGASTNINEQEPIPGGGDGHNHGGGTPGGSATGRLLVVNTEGLEAEVYNLADSELINSVAMDAAPSAVHATGDYRFAALVERGADKVSFIDGGLWQEPHDDHFDLFTSMPTLLNTSLSGSRPTHFVRHEGQVAVFLDGDSSTGNTAGVQVIDDRMIEEGDTPMTLAFALPQHGVAEPRGEHLITSIRRDDAQSTSTNFVLPDQVGVYHLHDGEYELEQTFDVACPDLHGAAQNDTHIIFGCSDGVLLVTDNNGTYSAEKLVNPDEIAEGLRIGSLWGHHASGQFIGQASGRTSETIQFVAIDPAAGDIDLIDWQPQANAKPVARDFTFAAEQFVILDDQGYLTFIEPHQEAGRTHWEYGERLGFTNADVSTMPEGSKFSMTLAQNAHTLFVADPIEQHILEVDLELLEVTADIELNYRPAMITWLGIAETDEQ